MLRRTHVLHGDFPARRVALANLSRQTKVAAGLGALEEWQSRRYAVRVREGPKTTFFSFNEPPLPRYVALLAGNEFHQIVALAIGGLLF